MIEINDEKILKIIFSACFILVDFSGCHTPAATPSPTAGGTGSRAPPHRRTWRTTRSSTRAAAPPHGDSASGVQAFFLFSTTNCAGGRRYRPASAKPICDGG